MMLLYWLIIFAPCQVYFMENSGPISDALKVANLFKKAKKDEVAKQLYLKIIEEYPSDFRAYFNLGQIYFHSNESEHALQHFKSVIKINKTIVCAYGLIASCYLKLLNPQKAIRFCETGLTLDPNDKSCLYNVNVALRQIGQIIEAIVLSWKYMNIERPLCISKRSINSPSSSHMTVVCVKWGKKYSAEYVNNLYYAVQRNISSGYHCSVVCFTEDSVGVNEHVTCVPFDQSLQHFQSWWLKTQVFSPNLCARLNPTVDDNDVPHSEGSALLSGWILFMDLDTVICNSLDFVFDLINRDSISERDMFFLNAGAMKNEGRPCGINSSIMLWHAGHHTELYTFLVEHYDTVTGCIYKFDHYLEMMRFDHIHTNSEVSSDKTINGNDISVVNISNGGVMNGNSNISDDGGDSSGSSGDGVGLDSGTEGVDFYCKYLQDVCPERVIEYAQLISADRHPDVSASSSTDCTAGTVGVAEPDFVSLIGQHSVVCFPLQPKPHQVTYSWVVQHWTGGKEI